MAPQRDRKKEFDEAYSHGWAGFGSWQAEAQNDIRACLGDSYTEKEKRRLLMQDRDLLNIQMIRRIVKWVAGYQADHRLATTYEPNEGGDARTSSQLSTVLAWLQSAYNGYEMISKGFEHSLKTGLSLINTFNNQNFDCELDIFYYNQFLIDPAFTRIDLKDCQFGITRKWVSESMAKILLPKSKHGKIKELSDARQNRDEKFPNYNNPHLFGERLLSYDEFQQRTTRNKHIIVLQDTGDEIDWFGPKAKLEQVIQAVAARTGVSLERIGVVSGVEPSVEMTAYLGGHEVNHEVDPWGIGDFSFTPIIAFYDPEYHEMRLKLQGLVRCLVDPQRANNRQIQAMLSYFEQVASSGLDYEENSLVDEEDAFTSGPGKPRKFKEGKLGNARDRQVASMPGGMLESYTVMDGIMPKMVNINESMFGTDANDARAQISGVAAKLRQGAGLVGLRGLFDDLSLSQKIIGRKQLKLIQQMPPHKIKRILGEEPTQEFYKNRFGKYDATTVEGILTDTQRNSTYLELISAKKLGVEVQDPAPITWEDLIEYIPLDANAKQQIIERVQQQQKAAQEQAQSQAQQQQQLQQVTIQALMAQLDEDKADAQEKRAQARENLSSAILNNAKAAVEIESLRDKSLLELIQMVVELNQASTPKQEVA